ncbi:MAG: hypothetical protein RBQ81_06710 [Arcobacteraceae bacterium]|jgi:ferrochelatase|nr:hypothetical protein [Arcobacteraceae bacterium]
MNITSLVELVDGELKNPPSISFVYNIQTNLKKLKNGDLFISDNQEDINKAVEKGAFGIIYKNDFIQISDKEIAWIKVNDINEATIKIIRYLLSNKELDVFYINEITYDIFNLMVLDSYYIYLQYDLNYLLDKLQSSSEFKLILSSNKELLAKIYPQYKTFINKKYQISNLTIHSIFETTFSYKDILYYRAKIPFFYINIFLSVVEYFKIDNPINEIQGLKKWNLLSPIFINKNFKQIEFGKSDKFILTSPAISKAIYTLTHIQKNFKYAKVQVLIHKEYSNVLKNAIFYQDGEELEFFIKTLNYNLLYIVGCDNNDIISILNKTLQSTTLFDI